MARRRYKIYNGASAALTAALATVTTGTSIKTMLQLKPTQPIAVTAWGYSFDAVPTSKVAVELLTTGTVAATVTAFATGDIPQKDDVVGATPPFTLATNGSGFTSTSEGTITTTRLLAYRNELGQSYESQDPLDREGMVNTGDILRIRVTTAAALGMTCWVEVEA